MIRGAGRGWGCARAFPHAAAAGDERSLSPDQVRAGSRAARSADPGDEPNAWRLDRCLAFAKAHKHPALSERTIWQAFEAERPNLVPITGPRDGFHAVQASVSKTCLVRFDDNKHSVNSRAVGRPVEIQACAERIVIRRDRAIVGDRRRVTPQLRPRRDDP